MTTAIERPCANPACFCETPDVTCSLWCGALDRPGGVRCICRHDGCARPVARVPVWTAGRRSITPGFGDPLPTRADRVVPGVRRRA